MTSSVSRLVRFVLGSSPVSPVVDSCEKVEALLCLGGCGVVYRLRTVSYGQIEL